MAADQEFLKAAGIAALPVERDRWHWLRHRWSAWTEPYSVEIVGVGLFVEGKRWVERRQDRWCLTCKQHEVREIKTP